MAKIKSTGSITFEIQQDTFPVKGIESIDDPHLIRAIKEERRIAAHDLYEETQKAFIAYEHPFDSKANEFGEHPEMVEPEKVLIRREGKTIVLEAIAAVAIEDVPNSGRFITHPDVPEIAVATATIKIAPLMHVVREYISFRDGASDILKEFASAGNISGMEALDAARKAFHYDVNQAVESLLQGQDIRVSGEGLYSPMRYFSAALMTHLLPAKAFKDKDFTRNTVGPRANGYSPRNTSEVWGRTNPFKQSFD